MNRPCPYCGELMYAHASVPKRPKGTPRKTWRNQHAKAFHKIMHTATRDHIIPRSRGGWGQRTVKVCRFCNTEKGSLTLEEYRRLRFEKYGERLGYESTDKMIEFGYKGLYPKQSL